MKKISVGKPFILYWLSIKSLFNNEEDRKNGHIDFFDGLRGWASVVVLFSHVLVCTFQEWSNFFWHHKYGKYFHFLVDGNYAVYTFFVLSGIVLSIGYFKNRDLISLYNLAIKRIPRLSIPILMSSLIIAIMMKLNLMFNQAAAEFQGGNDWLNSFYNFTASIKGVIRISLTDVFFKSNSSYNASLWTMHGEFTGSFLILIMLLCQHFVKRQAVPLMVIFGFYLFNVDLILLSFALGMVISYIWVEKHRFLETIQNNRLLNLVFICAFIFIYYKFGLIANLKPFVVFFMLFVLISVPFVQKMFSAKISRIFGKISFPLYIVHLPIICSLTSYLIVNYGDNQKVTIMWFSGITIIVAFTVAVLFYPVEKFALFASNSIAKYFRNEGSV